MASIDGDGSDPGGLTEGERWTRAALADLRARRYLPLAWAQFIGSSAIRSTADLRRRPDLALESALVVGAGAVPWIALRRGWALAWWGTVGAMLLTHVGMLEGPSGERRDGLGAANHATLARAWLVPAVLLCRERRSFAAAASAAFLTDALDGPLARREDGKTRLGAQMDHAVDVALTLAVAEGMRRRGWLSGTAGALVATRYALPVGLVTIHYFWRARSPRRDGLVPARVAGALVATGLVTGSLGSKRLSSVLLGLGVLLGAGRSVTSGMRALS